VKEREKAKQPKRFEIKKKQKEKDCKRIARIKMGLLQNKEPIADLLVQ
jgi:hypothetical protein